MPAPAQTSVAEIVAAARDILEREGAEALTMQRVATAVGVRAPSLYKRVADRSDLVRLVLEDVARELTETQDRAATTGDPASDLHALADAVRRFAHRRPAAYGLLFLPRADTGGDAILARSSEALLRTTTALVGEAQALAAARTVVAWAHGFVSMELAGNFRLGGRVDDAWDYGIARLTEALLAHR